jgi:hypothetical protein
VSNSNLEIDENKHVTAPTIIERLKNALYAVILGAVLFQFYFFYGAVHSGSFVPASIVIYLDNFYFLGYLALCGGLGWFAGQDFLNWLKVKMEFWKFW